MVAILVVTAIAEAASAAIAALTAVVSISIAAVALEAVHSAVTEGVAVASAAAGAAVGVVVDIGEGISVTEVVAASTVAAAATAVTAATAAVALQWVRRFVSLRLHRRYVQNVSRVERSRPCTRVTQMSLNLYSGTLSPPGTDHTAKTFQREGQGTQTGASRARERPWASAVIEKPAHSEINGENLCKNDTPHAVAT